MDTYKTELALFRVFAHCLKEGKDMPRLKRLESRVDAFYEKLTQPQKHDFCLLLEKEGLLAPEVKAPIVLFNGSLTKVTVA